MKSTPVKPFNPAWLGIFLVFIFIAMFGATAHAVNHYYVSPSGSGSACTQANPCGSISQAHSTLTVGGSGTCAAASGWLTVTNVGACVHVLPGNYSGTINTSKSGGSTTKIAYISETKWGAHLLSPQMTLNGNYSGIYGFDINGPSVTFAVLIQSGHNREVQYNYIHDINLNECSDRNGVGSANGVIHETTAPMDHDVINGNIIRHFGQSSCSHRGFHGIYADGAAVQITNNIISGGSGGWAIQKQYAGNTDCTPGTISNNTIFNNAAGMVLNDEGSACHIDHWTINNNIIVNNGIAGTAGRSDSFGIDFYSMRSAPNTLISNNMLYGNLPANTTCVGGSSCPPLLNPKVDSGPNATFVNFQSDTNSAPASNYSADNYQLKAGSNALQSGTTSCASSGMSPCVPTLDILGIVRLSSATALDLGAIEQQGAVASIPSAPTGLTAVVQ